MNNFLRRLELNGFKSFAQRTTLEFPGGITAIVGPNGSGKSNIIDAIRWLLGEREARNLRGVKVEDLIFAGTPKRSRLGQAQASLHFDNHHKFFPLESAEVAIMRQVSRDGISRYFLNKSEVRLKDIIDFFARARLGTKGLIVVTQGKSDIFVESSPLVRREMIEEMLGLREYQLKRIEAERRLKNAEINLDKVRALIDEILPHLRSLKRQTNRWEKRGQVQEELEKLEYQFFGSQFATLKKELTGIEEKIALHRKEFESLDAARAKAAEHLKNIETNQPKEREAIAAIKERMEKLLESRGLLQKELGKLEARIELGSRETTASSPHTNDLLELIQKVRHGLEAHLDEEDIEELRLAIQGFVNEIDEVLTGVSKEPDADRGDFPEEMRKITKELGGLEKQIASLKDEEKQLEKSQEYFYTAFKAAARELETAKDRIEQWGAKEREYSFEKERCALRREELSHQVAQFERNVRTFESYEGAPVSGNELDHIERQMLKYRGDLASMGEVDEALVKEARETETRYEFLGRELKDLTKAQSDLEELIAELTDKIKTEFEDALHRINAEFNKFFEVMFGGGHAKLKIKAPQSAKKQKEEIMADDETAASQSETEAPLEKAEEEQGGIEIELSLPRKRIRSLEMLSGGERSLVGIAALFALISVSPPPFLVLDEIDAALDDRNARRFAEMLKEFSKKIQFIVVTHNRVTMEAANVLYGITMNDDGTSKVLSLKFEG